MSEIQNPSGTPGDGSTRSGWRRYGPAAGFVIGGIVAGAVLTGTLTATAATGTEQSPSPGITSYGVPAQGYGLSRGTEEEGAPSGDCPPGAGGGPGALPEGGTGSSTTSTVTAEI